MTPSPDIQYRALLQALQEARTPFTGGTLTRCGLLDWINRRAAEIAATQHLWQMEQSPAPSPTSAQHVECKTCDGRGEVGGMVCNGPEPSFESDKCPDCNGTGLAQGDSAASSQRALVEALQAIVQSYRFRSNPFFQQAADDITAALDAAGRGEW